MQTWTERVLERLRFFGLSQTAIARRSGVSQSHLSRCLAGERRPSRRLAEEVNRELELAPAPHASERSRQD